MENKQKHLEFIQNTINRMGSNSFLLKGWTVTLIAGIFALAAKDSNSCYILLAYFPTLLFWFLDGYFLQQERLYRALYEDVRNKEESQIDFSMDTKPYIDKASKNTWFYSTFFSKTVGGSYFTLVIIILVIMYITIK